MLDNLKGINNLINKFRILDFHSYLLTTIWFIYTKMHVLSTPQTSIPRLNSFPSLFHLVSTCHPHLIG